MSSEADFFTESPLGDSIDEDVACADCGWHTELVGPLTLDGEVKEGGDMVCRRCGRKRGAIC